MRSLRDLQTGFARALLGGATAGVTPAIATDGIAAEARLDIYRHHVRTTLTEVLRAAYPVVCRLVDTRFFDYAADTFIRRHPPADPCLVEFGAGFPAFLEAFSACRYLVYLGDVARLEWAIHVAHHAEESVPLAAAALADLDPERLGELTLRLDPSLELVESLWPVDAIWRANRAEGPVVTVDLAAGDAFVLVYRHDDEIRVRSLTRAAFTFHAGIAAGRRLAEVAEAAAAVDPEFDLAQTLGELLSERIVVGFTLASSTKEAS